jgi:hypothetical protein
MTNHALWVRAVPSHAGSTISLGFDPFLHFSPSLNDTGAHLYEDDKPQMCFNGAKSWWLGWYSDPGKEGHVTISSESWEGKLVGIDDYVNNKFVNGEHHVIARIDRPSSDDDLYVMFNRMKGVNSEVVEDGDRVTVVSQSGVDTQSWLQGSLAEGEVGLRFDNWGGSGKSLVVEVCERVYKSQSPDYARVLVYLDDNVHNLSCESDSTSPTTSPTPSPSDFPTSNPTTSPTGSPTNSARQQSPTPSKSPTAAPSSNPTLSLSPTEAPTLSPTTEPTLAPTEYPTGAPTSAPTMVPTQLPTASPSVSPTKSHAPSVAPTESPTKSPVTVTSAPLLCFDQVNVEGSCVNDADCCGDMTCSRGNRWNRVCIVMIVSTDSTSSLD